MFLTLSQAARVAKKSKNTLIRAIEKGKLSATRGENNIYQIDPSELARCFGVDVERLARSGPPETSYKTEVEVLRALLEEVKASRDDLRRERDAYKAQAERLMEALILGPLRGPNSFVRWRACAQARTRSTRHGLTSAPKRPAAPRHIHASDRRR